MEDKQAIEKMEKPQTVLPEDTEFSTRSTTNNFRAILAKFPRLNRMPVVWILIGVLLPFLVSQYHQTQRNQAQELILRQINNTTSLTTLEKAYGMINIEVNTWYSSVCEPKAKYSVVGTIDLGWQDSPLESIQIDYANSGNTVTVNTPSPQILSCNFQHVRYFPHEIGENNPLCSPDPDEIDKVANYVTLRAIMNTAYDENNIIIEAEEATRNVLDGLIKSVNPDLVTNVTFQRTDSFQPIPPTCLPNEPLGWREENGVWYRN